MKRQVDIVGLNTYCKSKEAQKIKTIRRKDKSYTKPTLTKNTDSTLL